jgi:hypothetical protein
MRELLEDLLAAACLLGAFAGLTLWLVATS